MKNFSAEIHDFNHKPAVLNKVKNEWYTTDNSNILKSVDSHYNFNLNNIHNYLIMKNDYLFF